MIDEFIAKAGVNIIQSFVDVVIARAPAVVIGKSPAVLTANKAAVLVMS